MTPAWTWVRGFGQVDLQSNVVTGLLIWVSLWAAGWAVGLYATIGVLVSTLTAHLLGGDAKAIRLGLYGYSGCLAGIALVVNLGAHVSTLVLTVVGAVLCAILTAALNTFLAPHGLTALTAPFCLVSGVMVLGAPSFARIWHGAPDSARAGTVSAGTALTWNQAWHAFFCNVSQVFLVNSWYVGLIMLVGLAFAGWAVFAFTAGGSVVGTLAAWALGAPAQLIGNGIYGYNAVLVALALGAVLLEASPWSVGYALVGAAASVGLTASVTSLFTTFGGHTFTWPFILITWGFVLAAPAFSRLGKSA
ncbi:urea transporter [Mangrovactinospora gilvigrisea]|uniref:Urea transporter n=1 Tax=Mangrovactinospora gilvigrisea TaxID=1428644 RepID=A0A1J7CD74_9ACTN|nr:urea transporter [Mangrovactinospora gilvigrisea]